MMDKEKYDFIFIPTQLCSSIHGRRYGLTINTGSLQEMPVRTREYFMDFISKKIKTDYFYNFNYFINASAVLKECSGINSEIEFSNICPVLDPWWNVLDFKFNPSHLTVDSKGRNWLEVLVERIKINDRDIGKIQKYAADAVCEGENYPVMSDKWLKNLWHAICLDSRPEYIKKMINGIELFTKGWHRPNHMFSGRFGAPAKPDALWESREVLFSKIDEVNYYKNLLLKKEIEV
jgi:hypothetical protein